MPYDQIYFSFSASHMLAIHITQAKSIATASRRHHHHFFSSSFLLFCTTTARPCLIDIDEDTLGFEGKEEDKIRSSIPQRELIESNQSNCLYWKLIERRKQQQQQRQWCSLDILVHTVGWRCGDCFVRLRFVGEFTSLVVDLGESHRFGDGICAKA